MAALFYSSVSPCPKRVMLDSPSPTREQKARQAVAEAAASAGTQKWKMHMGQNTQSNSSRFKKKQSDRLPPPQAEWGSEQVRFCYFVHLQKMCFVIIFYHLIISRN